MGIIPQGLGQLYLNALPASLVAWPAFIALATIPLHMPAAASYVPSEPRIVDRVNASGQMDGQVFVRDYNGRSDLAVWISYTAHDAEVTVRDVDRPDVLTCRFVDGQPQEGRLQTQNAEFLPTIELSFNQGYGSGQLRNYCVRLMPYSEWLIRQAREWAG